MKVNTFENMPPYVCVWIMNYYFFERFTMAEEKMLLHHDLCKLDS